MRIKEIKDSHGYSLLFGKNIIKLYKLEKHLYEFEKFQLVNTKNIRLVNLLSEKFYSFIKKNKIVVMTENTARDRNQNRFMRGCGLKIMYSKKLFTRNLRTFTSVYTDNFEYKSINEIGNRKFSELFKVCIKDPIEKYIQFRKYEIRIKKLFRSVYTIDNWKVATLKNENVGIIMPHIFPEDLKLGTLLEIGLKPEHRGKGYGRVLHAHGLEILKQMGAKKYLGSTETTNHAMLRVFELNGCKKWFIRHFFYAE